MAERWSPEALHAVIGSLTESLGEPDRHRARDILDALADAGLLVEPGGETRVEYAIEMTDGDGGQVALAHRVEFDYRTVPVWSKGLAEGMVREAARHSPPARIVQRTVHVGPWQPTDTKEPSP